jgi:DNA-binding MarR family transcriptional regulator
MSTSLQFTDVLREWVKVSMHRSMQGFARWMNSCGLSKSQIGALMRLHYHGACPVSGIGDDLGITNAAASQLVDRLVQMGLIIRTEDLVDRRVKRVSLTEAGRDLLQQGLRARLEWMKDLETALTVEEKSAIEDVLHILIHAANQAEEELMHTH